MKKRILCLTLGLMLTISQAVPAGAASRKDQLKQDKAAAQSQLAAQESKINNLEDQKQTLSAEIDQLDSDLVNIMVEIEILDGELSDKEAQIEQTKADLAVAEENKQKQYEAMKKRIQYLYEKGGDDAWAQMLFQASDFTSLLNQAEYVQQMYDSDRNSLEEFKETVQQVKDLGDQLDSEKAELEAKVKRLENDVYKLQLERDILEKAGDILKKEEGINLDQLTNREKVFLIDALRNKYKLNELLPVLKLSKSSYCYQVQCIKSKDKYKELRQQIKELFMCNKEIYGYRRIHCLLRKDGIIVSEKIVRRIMNEEQLIVKAARKRKYNSYKGEITPEVDNIIKRDFSAKKPNEKWLTDITEFHIPAGKIYLSPIIDCFDGMVVSWTIGTSPNSKLANTMLQKAIEQLDPSEHPLVHSDRGCHYRWVE